MITPKTKALLVAMTLLGAAPAAIPALADNTAIISDEDKVEQKNDVDVKQKCKQENESGDNAAAIGSVAVDVDPQTNTCLNTAVVTATNANFDDDVITVAQFDDDICDVLDLAVSFENVDC
jgi:hypothetical protein